MTDEQRPRWRDMDRRYLLEGTMVALLILGPSIAVALALDLEEGSIAEWVAAMATVAAFIAAVYAGRAAAAALRIELAREGDRLQRERQEQASKVAAWYAHKRFTSKGRFAEMGFTLTGALIRNASDMPVYGVTVRFRLDGHGPAPQLVGMLPPHEEEPAFAELEDPQGAGWDIANAPSGQDILVDLSFRDANGQWWTRLADGQVIDRRNAWDPESG